ncbi:MAG: type IV secretion system protein VirB4 [Loktanella salsilacus]|jgi:type IV secretion system protein VirB4
MYELYRKMPYGVEFDDTVMILRDGSVCAAFEVHGIDADTSDSSDVLDLRARVSQILNGLDESFSFFIHRFRRDVQISGYTKPVHPFAHAVDDAWFDGLNASQPKEAVIVLTIVRANTNALRVPLLGKALKRVGRKNLAELAGSLSEITSMFADALNVTLTPLSIADGAFGSAMAVINFQPYVPMRRGLMTLVAQDVSDVSLEFGLDGVVDVNDGEAVGAVISVKENPTATTPGAIDALGALDDVVVVHSYAPIHRDNIVEQARTRILQMQASNDLAQRVENQLFEAVDRIESGELGVGEYRLTILVRAPGRKELDARVSDVMSICQRAGFRMLRDRTATATELLSCHPGNGHMTARSSYVTSETFADLASLHGADIGAGLGEVPWNEPITVMETERGTPYRFNLHPRGLPDAEPTNGHTLVLGPSNGGKTTTTLFLAAQALRHGGRLIALDKDRAMEMPIRAMGGTYAAVKVGDPTGLNPLLTESGPRGEAWLLSWFSALLENTGKPLTPTQSQALKSAIRQNASAPGNLKNFSQFVSLIGDADDGNDLALRMREWGPDGRYSWVFGTSDDVLVNFAANDVTALDLTEVLAAGTERTAILAYLFRALEMVMEEKRPMVLLVDEAWQVLDDPYFAIEMKKWLVTARKLNVVVVMLTQFPSQIQQSAAKSILEGLPNQLIFPNHRAEPGHYDGMSMSDGELSFILGKSLQGRKALHRTDAGSTILDVDLGRLGPLLTVLGGGRSGSARFGDDYRDRPDFWRDQNASDDPETSPERLAHV